MSKPSQLLLPFPPNVLVLCSSDLQSSPLLLRRDIVSVHRSSCCISFTDVSISTNREVAMFGRLIIEVEFAQNSFIPDLESFWESRIPFNYIPFNQSSAGDSREIKLPGPGNDTDLQHWNSKWLGKLKLVSPLRSLLARFVTEGGPSSSRIETETGVKELMVCLLYFGFISVDSVSGTWRLTKWSELIVLYFTDGHG